MSSPIKSDEVVLFFPTYGHRDGDRMRLAIHGWIFEPEADSRTRAAMLGLLRRAFQLGRDDVETSFFKQRMRAFLVDNERGKRIPVQLGDAIHTLAGSEANGHFRGVLDVPHEIVERLDHTEADGARWLAFEAVTNDGDGRRFAGRVQLIADSGVSVISDIDDTIKLSHVRDRRELLANTFLREFQAVPAMAAAYRRWSAAGACFHYVSASPWQLFEPLSDLLRREAFPAGSIHLRDFRLKDRSALDMLADSDEKKRPVIEEILAAFPNRSFVFVGDSGERDPEMYGELARRHLQQTRHVFIRNVSDEPWEADRYRQAFAGLPAQRWTVFDDANELPEEPGG